MSKIYEVTSGFVTFGIGIELQLSEAQAEPRMPSLQIRRKNIYGVTSPVQFKRGERLGIYEAFLTKSLLENLQEISDKKPEGKIEAPINYPCIQNVSSGKYNVFDENKNLLTEKPVKKNEAEKILVEILAKNQTNNDNPDKDDEKSDADNLDENKNPNV
jgi:hypothetical protein